MCGRFSLNTPIPELAEWFQVERLDVGTRPARYNIAPTEEVVVVRPVEGEREITELRWGLVPSWAE
ncbi:MAG: SOS response-associated peptidase family protein, partial [Gemmatimonadota bacterium]|nr:SOS response-associated peptidase family protein [Gemmatimonadota bacterium]